MALEDTKDKIVSVATKLFSRFGFQKTSMDEIAKFARKAKGSLYYHFANKEELFREVVVKEVDEIKSKLSDLLNNSEYSAEGKLKNYMLTRMELMQHAPNFQETMHPGEIDHYEFTDDIRHDFDAWERERLITIINDGVERGEFNIEIDTDVLSDIILMITKGLEIPFFVQGKYEQYLPHFDGMAKIILKGLK
jgi:AcrR family transcriptional regulator